jgi:hypothetical protein
MTPVTTSRADLLGSARPGSASSGPGVAADITRTPPSRLASLGKRYWAPRLQEW